MRSSLLALAVLCCICTFGIGNRVAAAAEPGVSQGAPVSSPAGDLATSQGEPASPAEPTDLKLPALDKLKVADAVRGVNAALCPARLPAGFATPSGAKTECKSERFGQYLCVTCCTCIMVGGEMDCQCVTECIQIF
jgi:hypothetical protein